MHDYELYREAEKLLQQGWTTGGWERDGAFCLTGAFGRVMWDATENREYEYAALQGADRVPNRIWHELADTIHVPADRRSLERWNDTPSTFRHRRVLRLVRKLRKRHESDWLRAQADADAAERAHVDAELDSRFASDREAAPPSARSPAINL